MTQGGREMAKMKPADDVSIGKFDILATYTYANPDYSPRFQQRGL
jgi:hypothetical protein